MAQAGTRPDRYDAGVWGRLLAGTVGSAAVVARIGLGTPSAVLAVACVLAAAAVVIVVLDGLCRAHAGAALLAGAFAMSALAALAWREGAVYPLVAATVATSLAYGAFVRWSLVPSWPQRRGKVAGPAVGALIVLDLAWFRRGMSPSVAMLTVLTVVLLELAARSPRTADVIDAAVVRLAHRLGVGVRVALGTTMMVLVVMPIHLVSRWFRYSPLDNGWVTSRTAWVVVDPSRLRTPDGSPARPTSMTMRDLESSPAVRRRSRRRLAVPLAAAALIAVVVVSPSWLPWNDTPPTNGAGQGSSFPAAFEDDPAFEDAPWARNVRLDLLEAWNNLEFNAALGGWSIKDLASEHVNVEGGERATVQPEPGDARPVTVWLFGGSAAFGAGQRDEHTIASELVRLAGEQGLSVQVRNFAVPATVNWQSAMLMIERLKWEPPPDLIVFYDGANDMALQDALAAQGRAASDRPASLIDAELDRMLRERAATSGGSADVLLPPSDGSDDDAPVGPAESAELIATRYGRGVEVARQFASSLGVPVVSFWQPDLRTKQPWSRADRETLERVGIDPDQLGDFRSRSDQVRRKVTAMGVVDLSDVFDDVSDPVFWDTVHTNELGARLVAEEMVAALMPRLRDLAEGRAG